MRPSCSANSISQSAIGSPSAPILGAVAAGRGSRAGAAWTTGFASGATAGLGAGALAPVLSRILSINTDFVARETDDTPRASAIARSCSRSFVSSCDFSRACAAIVVPAFVQSFQSLFSGDFWEIERPTEVRCSTLNQPKTSDGSLGEPRATSTLAPVSPVGNDLATTFCLENCHGAFLG